MNRFLLTLFAIFSACLLWAATEVVDGITWTYTIKNNEASVGGGSTSLPAVPTSTSGAIIIPATLGGKPVTSIGSYAFQDCSSLTSITLPENVTSIGNRAFRACLSLTSLTLPEGVTSIDSSAFSSCIGLTSITIPKSVTSIGSSAFNACPNLKRVHISDITAWLKIQFGVTASNPLVYAKEGLYLNGEKITTVTILEGITSIPNYAFKNCTSLTSVHIPTTCTTIPLDALPPNLMNITVAEGNLAFTAKDNILYSVNGEQKTILKILIGSLPTEVTLLEGLTSIPNEAFKNCTSLTSVHIPTTCTTIPLDALPPNLMNITVAEGNLAFTAKDNILYSVNGEQKTILKILTGSLPTEVTLLEGLTSIPNEAFKNCTSLISVSIPEGVTSIGANAFAGCMNLTSLQLPSTLTDISTNAFPPNITEVIVPDGNDAYIVKDNIFYSIIGNKKTIIRVLKGNIPQDVTILEGVTIIPEGAFVGCVELTSVVIPEGVSQIERLAFSNCTNLKSVSIPASVSSIQSSAFSNCTSLTEVHIADFDRWCAIDFSDTSANPLACAHHLYLNGKLLTTVDLQNGTINFPSCIRAASFAGWTDLTTIVDSEWNDIYSIGESAFAGCTGLKSIIIPSNVVEIGSYAFENCTAATELFIPKGCAYIGSGAFDNCSSVSTLYFCPNRDEANFDESNFISCLGGNITRYAATWCLSGLDIYNLEAIGIPEGVTQIDSSYWYNFSPDGNGLSLPRVTTLMLPSTLRVVEDDAFSGLEIYPSVLETNYIPENATGLENIFSYYASKLRIPSYLNCVNLTQIPYSTEIIEMHDGVTTIDNLRLSSNVRKIIFPAALECFSRLPFGIPDDSELEEVVISDNAAYCYVDNNILFNRETNTILLVAPKAALGEVQLPVGIKLIEAYAFQNCIGLTSIVLPNGVEMIDYGAFSGCSSLTSITLPEGLTSIGPWAFSGCTNLISLQLPSTLRSMPTDALPPNLTKITVAEDNPTYVAKDNILYSINGNQKTVVKILTSSLPTEVTLLEGLTSIPNDAFKNCVNLTSILIPEGVTSIGSNAFEGCTNLTSLQLPSTLTSMPMNALPPNLKAITVVEGNSAYAMKDNILYSVNGDQKTIVKILKDSLPAGVTLLEGTTSIPKDAFLKCRQLEQIMIPSSVTTIAESAFRDCEALKSIVIPEGVTSIGLKAFRNCKSLTLITLPNSLREVGNEAFYDCSGLTSVMIPEGVTSIGANAFTGCTNVTSLQLPSTLTSMPTNAFPPNLTEIKVVDGCQAYAAKDNILYSVNGEQKTIVKILTGSLPTEVTLLEGLTSIPNDAFKNCVNLTSIIIPEGVMSIGEDAFSGCSSLLTLTIPSSVASIGSYAFGYPSKSSSYLKTHLKNLTHLAFNGTVCSALLDDIEFFQSLYGWQVTYSEEYGADWKRAWQAYEKSKNPPQAGYLHIGASTRPNGPKVTILSSTIRESDPTILDVVYKVTSSKSTVKVRALAFQDGERSFSKVVRPETFVEGTAANIGDGIAANVEHTLSWKVASDWQTTLAKLKFEVLAVEDELLPLELVTLSAQGNQPAMQFSWNVVAKASIFDALLWLYADQDLGLTLANGTLKHGSQTLASGTAVHQTGYDALVYVYQKMGYELLQGERLEYVKRRTRLDLPSISQRQYAVKVLSETGSSDEE